MSDWRQQEELEQQQWESENGRPEQDAAPFSDEWWDAHAKAKAELEVILGGMKNDRKAN